MDEMRHLADDNAGHPFGGRAGPAANAKRTMGTADLARATGGDRVEEEAQPKGSSDSQPKGPSESASAPLLPESDTSALRRQWDAIQTGFVDEPRRAVEQADELVAGAMRHLAEVFAAERSNLEAQWDRGDHVSTEDLRLALQRYRTFFGRLLSI